jgi:hypothetical protein
MGSRLFLMVLLLAGVAASSSAQVTIDYGSKSSPSAKPIPPGIIGTQLGYLSGSGALATLKQGGFNTVRINANLGTVFAHGPNPEWNAIDPLLTTLQAAGLKALVVMGYTPGWLQPAVTPCPTTVLGLAPYYVEPTDIGAWAQLTAKFVDHVTSTFPGVVTDYEIWNEPDLPSALCVSPDSDTVRRNAYLAMYDAAAPAMRAAAHETIHIGGPVFVRLSPTWLNALLNDPVASQNLDFVSYHYYLGYTELIDAGMNWDGSGGVPSMLKLTQDPKKGFAAVFNSMSALVRAGSQPNPSSTPIYLTEYNDDAAFINAAVKNDCCRNSPQYAPLFNTMVVADLLNSVYSGAQNVPRNLSYFAANVNIGSFCLLGNIDPLMDCATAPGVPIQPYPQYYAYQLLTTPKYLNLAGGGNMALSVSIPSPLIGTAFYTPTSDVLVLVNPAGSDIANLTVNLQNPGTSPGTATAYLLNSAHTPPAATPVTFTGSLAAMSGTVTVPAFSVVAVSLAAQSPPPDFAATATPASATIKAGQQAQFTLTLTPFAGFRQAVNLSCSGAPQNATCAVAPTTVTLDGTNPGTATVTISTKSATAAASFIPGSSWTWIAIGVAMFAFLGMGFGRTPTARAGRLGIAVVLAAGMLASCGGGGGGGGGNPSSTPGSGTPAPSSTPGTPAGSYTLTVTESSGSITHTTQLPIQVQ